MTDRLVRGHVLVGGWPGSGKTTLARSLAGWWDVPLLSKDDVKEAMMDALGVPSTVAESRATGTAAVRVLLRVARSCPAAVVDSTWFGYTAPLVARLPGPVVEVRCRVPVELARQRYAARVRDARHIDALRDDAELWGREVAPLGVGPLVEVDTSVEVDVATVATRIAATVR